jgi:hypothetical protein
MAVGRIRCEGVPLPSRPSERGEEGVAKIKDMTGGLGAHSRSSRRSARRALSDRGLGPPVRRRER